MKKVAVFLCLMAGLAFAKTKSYTVTLFEPAMIGGTTLKAGDYKVEVQNQKLLVKHGKETTEASVKVENNPTKYGSTSVVYNTASGQNKVQAIQIGGTHMKLVLD